MAPDLGDEPWPRLWSREDVGTPIKSSNLKVLVSTAGVNQGVKRCQPKPPMVPSVPQGFLESDAGFGL
jgi:hypothetical protein